MTSEINPTGKRFLNQTSKVKEKKNPQTKKPLPENKASASTQDIRTDTTSRAKKTITSASEATKLANKIASDVVKTGSPSALVSNLEESRVKDLVAA